MNPLRPSASVLSKLGSIFYHAEEALSQKGHPFDIIAFRQLIADPEVRAWLAAMEKMAMIPQKR